MTAADYLRETSERMRDAYEGICHTHAIELARLLLAEGRAPWIARLRDVRTTATGDRFHGPLTPLRYLGGNAPTWTTHYVAASGRELYDPLVGTPLDLDAHAMAVFGRAIAIDVFLDTEATAQMLEEGTLVEAFRVTR